MSNHTKPDHSFVAVNEVAQKERETLQSSCTTLDEKVSEGKKALNNITEVMKSLEKNAKTVKVQIKEEKENILKMVEEKIQGSMSLPKNLLKKGNIDEILSSQKLINENIDKLAREKPEDLTSVNDGVIRYVPGDIGNINVDEIVGKFGFLEGMYII